MGQRKSINEKRLSKKEVQEIVRSEGQLHDEYTAVFKEVYASGHTKQDLVYELPGDRFLFVFDPNDSSPGGKGDIYASDYFIRFVKWNKRIKEDYGANRASSVDHWRFYSKHNSKLIDHVDALIHELAERLRIDRKFLDSSYKSLDLVSAKTEAYGIDNSIEELYDNLVAYVGEVLRVKVRGTWKINADFAGGDYPYIDVGLSTVQYMPINIVWNNLHGLDSVNLRKGAGNEARQAGWKANFERAFKNKT